ncbi:hypothetical protein Clacol_009796 [Clathrus columnatus]|uniref:Uncharacterized protein n=1 Tax=Clathrus columnatus TaxID=1419009 RepID=A0AAV5AR63_9AGAM|nr:hypothetical protein Clacol_009796 [Clathrus columnatus]
MSSDSPQSIRPENVDLLDPIPPKSSESDFEALIEVLGIASDNEDDAESTPQLGVKKPSYVSGNIGSDVPNTYSTQTDRLERTLDANRHVDDSGSPIDQLCFPSKDAEDLIDLSNNSPLWNHAATELPLQESTPSRLHTQVLRSSELTSITAALDLAHRETEELKKRCRELESLLPRSRSSEIKADRYPKDKIHYAEASSPDNIPKNDYIDDMHGRKALDIDSMSLPQARILLKFLLGTFSLSISEVQREAQHELQGRSTSYLAPRITLGGIRRSIEFVSHVDELVWRRSRLGSKYDNPYGEDNIQALQDRVDLWEKAKTAHNLQMHSPHGGGKPCGRRGHVTIHPSTGMAR